MHVKKILGLILVFTSYLSFAQKQGNIWYFGNHAGLDFSTGNPVPLLNGATYNQGFSYISEGTSVLSDSTGNLLFYSNGQNIWNSSHLVMPNGSGLLGNYSSTQAALIVPQPGSSRFFYLFTTDDFDNDNLQYGFRYSIIDLCLDNGLGDVMTGYKNIKMLDTVCEKLTAVKHANGTDYWIIVHKYFSNAFYAYQLSAGGITDTIVSNIGSRHPLPSLPNVTAYSIGQLKASPNGKKLCIVSANGYCIAEYFDFDNATGVVSNCVNIQPDSTYNYYGVSFSPDNLKLYIAGSLNDYAIYQYNLNAGGGNADSVRASRVVISNVSANFWGLQLANNGKIYVTRSNYSGNYNCLSVISNPNNVGFGCNYQDSIVYLGGKAYSMGLPNFIDSYDYSNTTYDCSIGIQENEWAGHVSIFPNPAGDIVIVTSNIEYDKLSILNCLGQIIFEKENPGLKERVDLKECKPGIYFCKIRKEQQERMFKIVKTD